MRMSTSSQAPLTVVTPTRDLPSVPSSPVHVALLSVNPLYKKEPKSNLPTRSPSVSG